MERLVPAAGWLRGYRRSWLRNDLIAGTTAAAVVIPQAMGYATVAGLPAQIGLYTCIVPMVAYAVLGGSRRLSFSTTSTIVVLVALALDAAGASGQDAVGAGATLTLLVGVALFGFWVLRLGWLLEAVSEATLIGLKVGVGMIIIADQLPKLLATPEPDRNGFPADLGNAATHLGSIHWLTATIGLGTIAGLVALRIWLPRVPGPLVAVAAGIGATALFGLSGHGVDLIPQVPSGLPAPAVPALDHAGALWPYALAIALMSYFESMTAARIARRVDDPPLRPGPEYVAVGTATVAGAFFATVPPAGGFSQTQVNTLAGARTQVSGLVTAGWAVLIALLLAPVLSDLPEATLGAIVVVAVGGLISIPAMARLGRIDRIELIVALATAVAALATNMLVGVVVGVVLTFYIVLRRINHPVIVELRRGPGRDDLHPARPGDLSVTGLLALRIEGGLYTLNVHKVQAEIYRRVAAVDPRPAVVLIDAGGTADTSVTVLDTLAETHRQLARQGVDLWVAALPTRALAKARHTAAWSEWAAAGRLHPTVAAAVSAHESEERHDPG